MEDDVFWQPMEMMRDPKLGIRRLAPWGVLKFLMLIAEGVTYKYDAKGNLLSYATNGTVVIEESNLAACLHHSLRWVREILKYLSENDYIHVERRKDLLRIAVNFKRWNTKGLPKNTWPASRTAMLALHGVRRRNRPIPPMLLPQKTESGEPIH